MEPYTWQSLQQSSYKMLLYCNPDAGANLPHEISTSLVATLSCSSSCRAAPGHASSKIVTPCAQCYTSLYTSTSIDLAGFFNQTLRSCNNSLQQTFVPKTLSKDTSAESVCDGASNSRPSCRKVGLGYSTILTLFLWPHHSTSGHTHCSPRSPGVVSPHLEWH